MYNKVVRAKWGYPANQLEATPPDPPLEDCLQQLDVYVGQLHDALKPGSLLFVCAGPGDTTHQRRKEVSNALDMTYVATMTLKTSKLMHAHQTMYA